MGDKEREEIGLEILEIIKEEEAFVKFYDHVSNLIDYMLRIECCTHCKLPDRPNVQEIYRALEDYRELKEGCKNVGK